jgi:thioredoxin-dependent peroxiredoxin
MRRKQNRDGSFGKRFAEIVGAALLATLASCVAPPAPPAPTAAACPSGAATSDLERTGVTTRAGAPLTLLGSDLKVGSTVPAAELFDGDMKPVRLEDFRGKVILLSVVPSLDTPVCERQTGQIAGRQADLPPDVAVLTISRDLPYAQGRVLEANGFKTRAVSDYRDGSFGRSFGVLVKETRLLARSVWVIDKSFHVTYREIVADQKEEPSYDPLIEAVKRALAY